MSSLPSDQIEVECQWLARIAQGDRQCFELLYDRFAPILFATALNILRDRGSAEDTLQEAFIQIWRQAGVYNPSRGKPLTWALAVMRNRAIDRLRVQVRRARLAREVEEGVSASDANPRASVILSEEGTLAVAALQKLRPEEREIIQLAFFQSLSHSEISDQLQLPLGTVKARMRRGMMRLRSLMGIRADERPG